jgi:hypothetical protein
MELTGSGDTQLGAVRAPMASEPAEGRLASDAIPALDICRDKRIIATPQTTAACDAGTYPSQDVSPDLALE